MTKVSHQDFIERLRSTEITALLYNLVEAKVGRHIDIIDKVPVDIIRKAEQALSSLINYCKTVDAGS